ncbi:MAG: polyphosphate polymerase domain-containing protein [Candidatus Latescibacterota bacterium]
MLSPFDLERHEIKYLVPNEFAGQIREYLSHYMELDPYAVGRPGNQYTVRSIYFDTRRFDSYYNKLDGLKIRKRLRLRTYNEFREDTAAFLEIKRRYGNIVVKERAMLPLPEVEPFFADHSVPGIGVEKSLDRKRVIGKFAYNLTKGDLRPTALIAYEREAFVGLMDDQVRVTIDRNVRSILFPELNELFHEDDLNTLIDRRFILEIKFDGYMPRWLRYLVATLSIRAESISKYCLGVGAWFGDQKPGFFKRHLVSISTRE